MKTHLIELTTELVIDGFHICELEVEAEYTYRKGKRDSHDEPGYGPEVEFVGVKMIGYGLGPNRAFRPQLAFPIPDDLAKHLLEHLQNDDYAQSKAVEAVEDDE